MPLTVCDYEPCVSLQNAVNQLVVIPKGASTFQLTVISTSKPPITYYVPLIYCPFCGTRVEEEWIESFLQKTQRHIV